MLIQEIIFRQQAAQVREVCICRFRDSIGSQKGLLFQRVLNQKCIIKG